MGPENLDEILLLVQALGIPWVTGMLIALWLGQRFGQRDHYPMLLFPAYGFFIGYALLVLSIQVLDALGYGIHFTGVMTVLTVAGFASLAGVLFGRSVGPVGERPPLRVRLWGLVAAALLLGLIGFHLGLIGAEVWWRPVFPWDAWTTWSARAKVWVFHDAIVPFVGPAEWLADGGARTYTVAAYDYPKFVSLVQAWDGIGLGYWHDSLVNLPWLLCGIAILMLLYAQGRIAGLGVVMAVLLAYLLISMPLFHTHIALAGYADLWQAGYTGAALIALFQWRYGDGDRLQGLLGLLMLGASLMIKEEGMVWALLAGAWLVLARVRWPLVVGLFVAAGGLGLFAFLRGELAVTLPGIGPLGFRDGLLMAPWLPKVALNFVDVTPSLLRGLFQYESWNLFWYGVVFSLPLLALRPREPAKRALALLLVLVAATLFVIFYLTDAGNWAEDATAFSRVLMQWLPVLLFLQALVWQRHWQGRAVR